MNTFYFYDLETSGFNPREARIMQFAGQRTDMDLNPVGEPHNVLIKMTDDVVPEPDAILVTGITPQKTLADGITEAEFLKLFSDEISIPGTIFIGFNTIRFDDEFMRFLHYRNFYDPYEWQWMDNKSKWDLLDVVRLTRALRPEGIKWPVDSDGAPSNKLGLLTSINNISHQNAHDALSDVRASIDLAKLLKTKQPKLFDYLLGMREKKKIEQLVEAGQPFVYASGKFPSQYEKTTVVGLLAKNPNRSGSALVFDLRHNPQDFVEMTPSALAEAWKFSKDEKAVRLPVKSLQYNRCPAIAPMGVLDPDSQKRLSLDPKVYEANFKSLQKVGKELSIKVLQALELLDKKQQAKLLEDETEVDAQLYDGFFENEDKTKMRVVRAATPDEISSIDNTFRDQRLRALLPLYRARNFSNVMTDEDRTAWETFRVRKLTGGGTASRLAKFFNRLGELAEQNGLTNEQMYLLEELQLYGQSIMPDTD